MAAAGLAAGGTAGPLLAVELLGGDLVGVPVTLLVVGSALAAPLLGWMARWAGRRRAIAVGYAVGAAGAVVVLLAATSSQPAGFLLGCVLLGAGNTAVFTSRYAAAAEAGADSRRQAGAIASVLTATSVGAVVSPVLAGPLGRVIAPVGLPAFSGLYVGAAVVYVLAAAVLLAGGHAGAVPVAHVAVAHPAHARDGPSRSRGRTMALWQLGSVNLLMVAVMTVAPVHLADHGAGADAVGLVVAIHVAAMFGPSALSGWLVQRWGSRAVFAVGMAVAALAGVVAVLLDRDQSTTAAPALVLLGLGWNLGVVAASALLLSSGAGPVGEAYGEISMNVAAAVGSTAAGLGVAAAGLGAAWLASSGLAVVVVVTTLVSSHARDTPGPLGS